MISQILNRQFVLDQIPDVLAELQGDELRKPGSDASQMQLNAEDLDRAAAQLAEAFAKEQVRSSGQPAFEMPPAERRGEEAPSIDDWAFISRDPVLSLVQSALEKCIEEQTPEALEPADEGDTSRRGGGDEEPVVAETSLAGFKPRRTSEGRRLFDRFSVTDPQWVASVIAKGIRALTGKHRFKDAAAAPLRIRDDARILLVGDWGSGIPRARKVSEQMRVELDKGKAEHREQHVIHLGDVYYSGWDHEYEKRFLPWWPVRENEASEITSWCLNGNHDMYSGGYGYYQVALGDPRFARQQGSSFFSFFNSRWNILGLDTAYDDHDLTGSQPEWVQQNLAAGGRRGMLLSHHQLFSAYESQGPKLAEKLVDVLAAKAVNAWFWGHEHRCVVYERDQQNVGFSSCVGHGGVPVYMNHKLDDPYEAPVTYEYREFIDKGIEHWALFGFVILDFTATAIQVRYIDENGAVHRQETLT